jgi:transcriptional regulator with XRE-family HTH domain
MQNMQVPAGDQLREWRQRRRRSQLDLALDAEISTRHLSFIETGRSRPSREMIDRLAHQLDIPPRAANSIMIAAGFAPAHGERSLSDPEMDAARTAIDHLLQGYEPFPALAVDRHWNIVASNAAAALLTEQASPALLNGQANALRIALHPDGLAPQIVNFAEWRGHILERLDRQIAQSADEGLMALRAELTGYPDAGGSNDNHSYNPVAVPLVLDTIGGRMSFISTTTVFGTPVDVTLSEIAIEAFLPADAQTRTMLETMVKAH